MILLRRLLRAGADSRICPTQFGFRRHRGTEDALHCARRAIDRALADKNGRLHLLALDWQKAFDSINADAMMNALRRFGVPLHFRQVVTSIYSGRVFEVRECSEASERSCQDSGICQGCPLSPFLFVIVMTLLMHDAKQLLSTSARNAMSRGDLSDILYADDTLLMGSVAAHVEEYALAVERAGAMYGMSLHWGKTQALRVGDADVMRKADGSVFDDTGTLQYLGAVLCSDGRIDSELSRKLGTARGDFNKLQKVWGHSAVSLPDKLRFFNAFVLSKLRYGLATIWLVTAQRRRVDGFVARCLRRLLRIPAAFVSRISNATVLARAGVKPFSQQVLRHQLCLLRKVSLAAPDHPLRKDTFIDSTLIPQIGHFVRRVGRPRQDWTTQLLREGEARFGPTNFQTLLCDGSDEANVRWKKEVDECYG